MDLERATLWAKVGVPYGVHCSDRACQRSWLSYMLDCEWVNLQATLCAGLLSLPIFGHQHGLPMQLAELCA